jgi:Xaa-Pro aminopeptidase
MNYLERRRRLAAAIGGGALVLPTNHEHIRSRDTHYEYRPSSDLLYFTGFDEPEAIMVLVPGHAEHEFVLFVRPKNRESEIWDGFRWGPEGAKEQFGADAAFPISEFATRLPGLLAGRPALYHALGVDRAFDDQILAALRSLGPTRRTPDRAPNAIVDPRPVMHAMRRIKDADEISVMDRAGQITARAHLDAMRATRPGLNEFEIQAHIEHYFRKEGARGPSYGSIVASGANACTLHYVSNNRVMRDGELLLVDAGCELDWYAADITRTWPVGAAFSGEQRAVYEAVLDVQLQAIADIRPGISVHELQQNTIRRTTEHLVALGLLSGSVDSNIETEAFKRFYMHGIGHYLGMDVHDVGAYLVDGGAGIALEPGVVITVEPGIYIAPDDELVPEGFRGIGVRIEDDVVVGHQSNQILTSLVPKAVDEIEAIRRDALR